MTNQSKQTIKSYFQTGDKPTESQFGNLIDSYQSVCAVSVIDYGALGNGSNDDTQAFIDAIATGNNVIIPSGNYVLSSPITISQGRQNFICLPGAILYPSHSGDVIRITGYQNELQINIDGTNQPSGTTSKAVVVGYGGANSYLCYINGNIQNIQGRGIVWDQGSFLRTDVRIYNCSSDGILCTNNYDDNNHGDISATISSCAGYGFRTVYSATLSLNSRHNYFRNLKAFSCTLGGVLIETIDNVGQIFTELNSVFQIKLDTNAYGNTIFCMGSNGVTDVTEVTSGNNFLIGRWGSYNFTILKNLLTEKIKIRSQSYVGSLVINNSADNKVTLSDANQANANFTLSRNNSSGGSYKFIDEIDKLQFITGSGAIDRFQTTTTNLNFGSSVTDGSCASATFTYSGVVATSGTVIITSKGGSSYDKVFFSGYPSSSGGAIIVNAFNKSGSTLNLSSVPLTITYMTHF